MIIKPACNILVTTPFDRVHEYMTHTEETMKAHKILVKNPKGKAKNG
jgi:hypothetical protein